MAPGDAARARWRSMTWWAATSAATVALAGAAVALGIWSDEGQRLSGFGGWLPELGTPWILLAFLTGRVVAQAARWAAPLGSVASVGLGLASYAVFVHLHYGVDLQQVEGGRPGYWWWMAGSSGALAGLIAVASCTRAALVAWATAAAIPLAEIRLVREWHLDGHTQIAVTASLAAMSLLVTVWACAAMRRAPLALGPLTALMWAVGWVAVGQLVGLGAL